MVIVPFFRSLGVFTGHNSRLIHIGVEKLESFILKSLKLQSFRLSWKSPNEVGKNNRNFQYKNFSLIGLNWDQSKEQKSFNWKIHRKFQLQFPTIYFTTDPNTLFGVTWNKSQGIAVSWKFLILKFHHFLVWQSATSVRNFFILAPFSQKQNFCLLRF